MFFSFFFVKIYFYLKVVDIMRMNVDKVLERDQKLSQLDDRAGKIYIFKEKMFDSKKRVFLFI